MAQSRIEQILLYSLGRESSLPTCLSRVEELLVELISEMKNDETGNSQTVVKIGGRVDTVSELPLIADEGTLYFVGYISDANKAEYIMTSDGTWELLGYSTVNADTNKYPKVYKDINEGEGKVTLSDGIYFSPSKFRQANSIFNDLICIVWCTEYVPQNKSIAIIGYDRMSSDGNIYNGVSFIGDERYYYSIAKNNTNNTIKISNTVSQYTAPGVNVLVLAEVER